MSEEQKLCPVCDSPLRLTDDSGREDGMQPPWYSYACPMCNWALGWARTPELAEIVLERKLVQVELDARRELIKAGAKCVAELDEIATKAIALAAGAGSGEGNAIIPIGALYQAIEQRELTQKQAAQLLEVSPSYLSDILAGRRAISVRMAVKIEQIFRIDAIELLQAQVEFEVELERQKQQPIG